MFDLQEEFGSDEKAEREGVWIDLSDESAVKVARLGNADAQKAYRKIPRAIRRNVEEGTMGNKQAIQFIAKFMAQHILKDWKDLVVGGEVLPKYNEELGTKYLVKFRRFRDKIWDISMDDDLFNVGELEEDAKNLPKRSSGISDTVQEK